MSLVNKKLRYNTLHTYKIEKNILRNKQRYYELGEKAHKILSWQLRKEETSRTINSIQTETGSVSHNPTEINDAFKQFYTHLYTSEPPENLSNIDDFLSMIELPKLGQEDQNSLDLPFTQKEIEKAMGSLQANKLSGSVDEGRTQMQFFQKIKRFIPNQDREHEQKARQSRIINILRTMIKQD